MARSCQLLNALCSMKLDALISRALTLRRVVSPVPLPKVVHSQEIFPVTCTQLAHLLKSLRSAQAIAMNHAPWDNTVEAALKDALRRCSGSLRHASLHYGIATDSEMLQLVFATCSSLRSLSLDGFSLCRQVPALSPLLDLEKLVVGERNDMAVAIFQGSPNLTDLTVGIYALGSWELTDALLK